MSNIRQNMSKESLYMVCENANQGHPWSDGEISFQHLQL